MTREARRRTDGHHEDLRSHPLVVQPHGPLSPQPPFRPWGTHRTQSLPGRPTPIDCVAVCFVQSYSRGRRPIGRVLRGGAFNNQPRNLRSANRNRNQPGNRNNNIGFRPASTSQQTSAFAQPESVGISPSERAKCKVQVVVPCRATVPCLGQMKLWPFGSGRPNGSKAPPGLFIV